MTGGTVPIGLDGNGYAGAFPAPFGMVSLYVWLQSCLCRLWREVELKCGQLALGEPGVKAEDSLAGG